MYKKKKQKVKFKLRIELLVVFIVILGMIATSVVLRLPDSKTKLANTYGGALDSTHIFEELTFDELYTEIKNEGFTFVYFGSPECTDSVSTISTINTRGIYWDVETIYYVDATNYLIDEDADDYEEDKDLTSEIASIEAKLNTNVAVDIVEISLEFTPSIWVFENDTLVFNSSNYLNEDEDLSWSNISDRAFCVNLPKFDEGNE